MSRTNIILWIWRATMLFQVALCVKLFATGLWRPYGRFTAYMVGLTVESGVLSLLAHRASAYQLTWSITRPILLLLELLVIYEIFSRWAESHQNMGKFGQRLFLLLLGMSAVLAIATVPMTRTNGFAFVLYVLLVANRAVQFGAGAFMLLMLGFFAKFGGPVARNLRWHAGAMTAFALANALTYLLFLLFPTENARFVANVLLQGVTLVALLCWMVALKPSGETAPQIAINAEESAEAEEQHRQLLEFAEATKQQRQREKG